MTISYLALVEDIETINKLSSLEMEIDLYKDLTKLQQKIRQTTTSSVVFLENHLKYDLFSICQMLSQEYSHISIVLLEKESPLNLRLALKSGASDVVSTKLSKEQFITEIEPVITRLKNKSKKEPIGKEHSLVNKQKGKVITVCSTKGGVGKTTFAVNLAAASAKNNQKTVIVDLNLQFGDVALFLDRKPKKTIYDWVKESQLQQNELIDSYLTIHSNQFCFLAAPQRPEFAEVITGTHIKQLIKELKLKFDLIIFDTNSYMEENVLVALESSDEVFMLTYLDLPTLKNSRLLLETLESLSIKHKAKAILNKETKVKGLTSSTAEDILGMPIYANIPSMEKLAVDAVNIGNPIILSHPKSRFSKSIFSLLNKTFILERKQKKHKEKTKKSILSIEGNI